MESRLAILLRLRHKLNTVKVTLDKDAAMDTWEGRAYARTLVDLVLVQMEIEQLQKKEKAAH